MRFMTIPLKHKTPLFSMRHAVTDHFHHTLPHQVNGAATQYRLILLLDLHLFPDLSIIIYSSIKGKGARRNHLHHAFLMEKL